MAKKVDYFGLGYWVSLVLAIIPVTSWFFGVLTRFAEGRPVAALIRLVLGFNIIWILDLIFMFLGQRIFRCLNK